MSARESVGTGKRIAGGALATWLLACGPAPTTDAGSDAGMDAVAADGVAAEAGPQDTPAQVTSRMMIGAPLWDFVDLRVVTIVGGTRADSYAAFITFRDQFLAPNHRYYAMDGTIGPGAAHAGPYDHELSAALVAGGHPGRTVFTVDEFTEPNGIVLLGTVVPTAGAPMGSSSDGAAEPIIPQRAFPLQITGAALREEQTFDTGFGASYPGPTMLHPPLAFDGYSHFPLQFGETSAYLPPGTPAAGHYSFLARMIDATGSGWQYTVAFEVR